MQCRSYFYLTQGRLNFSVAPNPPVCDFSRIAGYCSTPGTYSFIINGISLIVTPMILKELSLVSPPVRVAFTVSDLPNLNSDGNWALLIKQIDSAGHLIIRVKIPV